MPTREEIAMDNLGFEICEWPPEPADKCERCKKKNVQMYFSPDGFGEGVYWCIDCIVAVYDQNLFDLACNAEGL